VIAGFGVGLSGNEPENAKAGARRVVVNLTGNHRAGFESSLQCLVDLAGSGF
jgi:hypothetical protein